MATELVDAQVFHARNWPARNAFRYGVSYMRVRLETFAKPSGQGLFSIDRFTLFSLRNRDYRVNGMNPGEWVPAKLAEYDLSEADREISLLTLPRVLGFAFNPVRFFFCCDREKRLRAVIAMVNNTFGERHSYICFHEDRRPIGPKDWLVADKIFHVSPFLAVRGQYRFRFDCSGAHVAIWINHYDEGRLSLSTSLIGKARPATASRLFSAGLRFPFMALKVVALIHYQAAKLFLKGVRSHRKPPPPLSEMSR